MLYFQITLRLILFSLVNQLDKGLLLVFPVGALAWFESQTSSKEAITRVIEYGMERNKLFS